MAVDRAPYINYFESLERGSLVNDAEIPIFIGSSLKSTPTITELEKFSKYDKVTAFDKLGAEIKFKCEKSSEIDYFSSLEEASDKGFTPVTDSEGNPIKEVDSFVELIGDFIEENVQYGAEGINSLHFYVIDLPKTATIEDILDIIIKSKVKREATVIVLGLKDDTYVLSAKTQYKYSKTGSDPVEYKWFDADGTHEGYTQVLDDDEPVTRDLVKGDYNDDETLTSTVTAIASELNAEIINGILRIAYFGLDKVGTDKVYTERVSQVRDKLARVTGASRIAMIEKPLMGKTIAKICTTEYYIEPGYEGYRSVEIGTFDEKTPELRDDLFNLGLIFNEDDYTLPEVTPRICMTTSCAWGLEDADNRRNDALIHARRNVDWQVRQILKLASPQLKRNETSVNIAFLKTDILNHLIEQKRLGRVVDYQIAIDESNTNPFQLHIYGKMIPVNSTMAIEFSNYIGSPVIRATDLI